MWRGSILFWQRIKKIPLAIRIEFPNVFQEESSYVPIAIIVPVEVSWQGFAADECANHLNEGLAGSRR